MNHPYESKTIDWQRMAAQGWLTKQQARERGLAVPLPAACNCVGPQNGQPVCPCAMRGVAIENGRYVRHVDLGPAPGSKP